MDVISVRCLGEGKGDPASVGKGGKFVIMERDEEDEKANEFDGS